jgi:hypothetical protein
LRMRKASDRSSATTKEKVDPGQAHLGVCR